MSITETEKENRHNPIDQKITHDYPIRLNIEYSEKLSRITTFLRVLLIIPILILLATISGGIAIHGHEESIIVGAGGLLFLGPLLMILFRKKYPRWWFDWNVNLMKLVQRVVAYFYCLTDEYPDMEKEQKVHLEIDYPEHGSLCRWAPLFKWFLAIPHFVILILLSIVALVVLLLSWISILVIGRYPHAFFNFIVGFMRWSVRVYGYALILATDKYPPFSLK